MDFINLMNLFQISLIVKLFLIVLAAFYLVFAIVVYRQVSLMNQTLNSSVAPIIKILSVLQIAGAGGILILAAVLG